jgi:deoxyribodipyrimidine photo-lyase
MSAVIVWLRRDLRLSDNAALTAAAEMGLPVIPVFIWAPSEEAPWQPGAVSQWWLHQSLQSLSESFRSEDSKLIIRSGRSLDQLLEIVKKTNATHVFWNRLYDPKTKERDESVKTELKKRGIEAKSFNSSLLYEPWTIETGQKKPFQVFTPYSRKCLVEAPSTPISKPKKIQAPKQWPPSESIDSLELLPAKIRWDKKIATHWTPGEAQASKHLSAFLKSAVENYSEGRDTPSVLGTSRLSPYLHFGEIGPRQVWQKTTEAQKAIKGSAGKASSQKFLMEIIWREFAHHVLFHFPFTADEPLRGDFKKFPWKHHTKSYRAWCQGETGYPIVDAGMRQLWETGWMHNRVRMIVASLLTKHLLMSWKDGAQWFWDTLVDADLAANSLGWQWAGGCGADAAPYFRIFNPVLQGEKFDPEGLYVKHWVPELKSVPSSHIHRPWEWSAQKISYPKPVIELGEGRDRALTAFKEYKK